MASVLFKRLFEVRVLHGHYLDFRQAKKAGEAPTFFHDLDDVARQNLLENLHANGNYDLFHDLDIRPDGPTEQLLKDLKMRFAKAGDRFFVGIEVEKTKTANSFKLKRPLPDGNLKWTFLLRPRHPDWLQFTNHSLQPSWPAVPLFSNSEAMAAGRVFPSLARKISAFSNKKTWKMGELAFHAAETTPRFALKNTASDVAGNWSEPLALNFQWASEADRVLLPNRFKYRFDALAKPVSQAVFTLKNEAGIVLKTISKTVAPTDAPLTDFPLDFTFQDLKDPADPTRFLKTPDGWYVLSVNVNGADVDARRVLLRSDLQTEGLFAVVEIEHRPDLEGDFRLLDAPTKTLLSPRFEIRWMSRPTWWAYFFKKENAAPPVVGEVELATDFADPHVLVSKKIRHLTKAPQQVIYDSTGSPTRVPYLPNPPDFRLLLKGERLYSPISISIPLS